MITNTIQVKLGYLLQYFTFVINMIVISQVSDKSLQEEQ